jgi:prenyltransferase beta subunit
VRSFAAALISGLVYCTFANAGEPPGAAVYQQKCARCHGKAGEGTKAHPHALIGNRSLVQLTKYIAKFMPEDAPRTLNDKDAQAVATYIFDAFYSPAAQARIKAPRVELARLTVNEYRNAVADLVGGFHTGAPRAKNAKDDLGLRGDYFTGPPGGKKKSGRTLAFARIDPLVQFDFASADKDFEKLKTPEIAATWQGSVVALDTGLYEFIVRTEHSTRLWVNDLKKPLIDKAVKSGDDTEFRESIYLLGGRAYPVKLEFSRGGVGVRKDPKESLLKLKTTIALEWKPPHRAAEPIPQRNLRPFDAPTSFAVATALPPDDRSAGYERGTAVSKEWLLATTDGAIATANYIVAHLPDLSGVKNDAANRKALLQDYCVKLTERAFRRPLTPDQKKLYIARQFDAAKDVETAVKRVVLLVLQSPRFLYREPASVAPVADGDANDAFDVAARISFGLWDTLPDDELLKAAASGRLKTRADVAREAERMLNDPRARARLRGFFLRWLQVDQVAELTKDAKLFPGFDAAVVSDLKTSLELMLEETLWSKDSDFRRLLLANDLYLNGRLAKLYGGDLPLDAPFQKSPQKLGERAGVLTHPFMLAHFSYAATSSPIHRGVFLARNVLGVALRQPPDAFTPLAAEAHPKLNTRERITLQTSPKDCRGCHGIINPLGFTLENFDAIGRFRTTDNNKPIDASGSFMTRSGDQVTFKNVQDLARFLASSDEAHEAFVARLFHHTVRQPILAYGPTKLDELRRYFADNNCDMRRLLVEIIAQSALPERGKPATAGEKPSTEDVLKGLQAFAKTTARADGSFRPGVDPEYRGMSDSAYSNLAPVTYAVVIHRTFGWTLPHEDKTLTWIINRQQKDGAFTHAAGTVDPKSAQGRVYNTTMALMALKGLDSRPAYDPLPVFAKVMEKDYKNLPAYSSSFFPLAYRLAGAKMPDGADQAMRATMIQADDGYLNDHVAATFHAVHYDRLMNVKTPKADLILKRCLREQKPDGSWMLNPLARDRHACFDAVFMLKHLGADREDCRKAMDRAADWALSCRNKDGGFGHYPGSPSDWDAVYFHVGTLVMAGRLTPAKNLPKDAHLLGWGHLFP